MSDVKMYDGAPEMEIEDIRYKAIQIDDGKEVESVLMKGRAMEEPACQEVEECVRVACPNTSWSASNPTLCILAFLGLSPRQMDEAVGRTVPFVPTDKEEPHLIPEEVIKTGRRRLRNSSWFVPEDEASI